MNELSKNVTRDLWLFFSKAKFSLVNKNFITKNLSTVRMWCEKKETQKLIDTE